MESKMSWPSVKKRISLRLSLFVPVFMFVAFIGSQQVRAETKKIVVIHSYPPGEWYHGFNKSFEKTIGQLGISVELYPEVYHSEYWSDQPQVQRAKEKERLISFIKSKSPDMIILCDDEAVDFLIKDTSKFNIPILVTGINRPKSDLEWLPTLDKDAIAGTLEIYRIDESIELLQKLKPNAKRMSILTSSNATSKIVADVISQRMKQKDFQSKYGVKLIGVHTLKYWKQWKEITPKLSKENDALWVLVPYDVRDHNNHEVSIERIGSWLRKNLTIPTLGILSIHIKIGLLAAISVAPAGLGRQSAEQAARYFKGTKLSKIGIVPLRYHNAELNLNEVNRLNLKVPSDLMSIAEFTTNPELKYGR